MDHAVISMENSMENSMDGLLEKTTVKKAQCITLAFLQGFQVPEISSTIVEKFDFGAAPPLGTIVNYNGQAYELTLIEPYERRDGSPSNVLTWRSACPNCARHFEIQTGLRAKWPNRRCQACKAPGRYVRKDRAA